MVTYEYESKFKNHTSVTWIVISHGGTFSWDSTDHEYKSTASDFFMQGADFVSESVILDEKLCSEDNLKFGLCEAAYFSIQIKNITGVPNLKDEMIDVYFYFDNDPDTLFRVGTYKVDTDKYSADRQLRTLDCYDLLYYLWDYDITEWYYGSKSVQSVYSDGQAHTMSDLITDLFDYLQDEGVEISLKANQTLINGTYTIPKNIETDTLTFGFWIQPVLEANAAFGNINRDGEFEWIVLEWYDKAPKRVLNDYNRRPPTPYEDKATWGIGQIDVYNRDNNKIFTYRNSSKKRPSKYSIVDSFVFDGREPDDANVMTLLTNMHDAIWHTNYRTYEAQTYGDLCLEVGDRIDVYFDTDEPTEHRIRSYVLERHFTGLNALRDSYSARGDLKQPNYSVNGNWHSGDSVSGNSGNSGAYELDTEHDRHLIQVLRNGGYRFLDEPSDVAIYYDSANMQMKFKWTDPDDITDYKPLPCEWVGTVIIRKENERPLHRWDGTLIVRSTTRDEYSDDWYVDDTIEANKKYYYAIMPYYIALDDNDHPIRHYTWTKVIILNTQITISAPEITNLEVDGTSVEVTFTIPTLDSGTYTSLKLVAKKGDIPANKTDGDVIEDIIASDTSITVSGLDEESHYYFVIFAEDSIGNSTASDPEDIVTTVDAGWNFSYTGEIQTFTAPKTGIYSLETWGSQGGDATDGTNTARGGYGAYAYGEVFLTQGDELYINVGGQNGYGGGGRKLISYTLDELIINHLSQYTSQQSNPYTFPYSVAEGQNILYGAIYRRPLTDQGSNQYQFAYASSISDSDSAFAIAIPRGEIKEITLKCGVFQTSSNRCNAVGINIVDDDTQTETGRNWFNYDHQDISTVNVPNTNTYYEFTVQVEQNANYIVFNCADGLWKIKDVRVTYYV